MEHEDTGLHNFSDKNKIKWNLEHLTVVSRIDLIKSRTFSNMQKQILESKKVDTFVWNEEIIDNIT